MQTVSCVESLFSIVLNFVLVSVTFAPVSLFLLNLPTMVKLSELHLLIVPGGLSAQTTIAIDRMPTRSHSLSGQSFLHLERWLEKST